MANYVKSTNFTAKDTLVSGDPLKKVKGTEIDVEFNAIATAISSKADAESPTFTGTPVAPTAAPGTNTTQLATTAFVKTAVDNFVVTSSDIQNDAITTAKIANDAVTTDKIADNAVTTANIVNDAITTDKIINDAVTSNKIINGAITPSKLSGGQTGSAPIYGIRAWANWDGTKDSTGASSTANTNRLLRASGNISSVLRNGTGDYTVTFTTAMPDVNFAVHLTGKRISGDTADVAVFVSSSDVDSVSSVRVRSFASNNGGFNAVDYEKLYITVIR